MVGQMKIDKVNTANTATPHWNA